MITYKEDGEPNVYIMFDDNNWIANIRLNGEYSLDRQRDIMNRLIREESLIELLRRPIRGRHFDGTGIKE